MRRIPAALLSLLCLFCLISLGCRASIPSIPVRGNLAGQVIDTTVDSEFARYYLEHYLQNKKTKPEFDSMIDQIHQQTKDALPSREYLKYLSEKFSVDFATLYLAQHLLEDRSNTSLQSAFYEAFSKTKIAIKTGTFQLPSESSSSLILFVPGWFYKSDPETGADFARPRHVLTHIGLENSLIDIEENGVIEENAAFIAQEILRYRRLNKNIILVSAELGLDHFFLDPEIDLKTVALAQTIIQYLESR